MSTPSNQTATSSLDDIAVHGEQRRRRQVSASDLHRLLCRRLTEKANAFYGANVRKAAERKIPLRYSIDRILRVLVTGIQWHQLDTNCGCWSTHYKRFLLLSHHGVFDEAFEGLVREYLEKRDGDARLIIDGTHIKARYGGQMVGKSPVDRGKLGSKMTAITDEYSIPLCATFSAGNVSDTIQLVPTLEKAKTQFGNLSRFRELFADKGYDSNCNRLMCLSHGLTPRILFRRRRRRQRERVNVVASNPENTRMEELRKPVERCFAWQDNFRRIIIRYERLRCTFCAMSFLSLSAIVCRRLCAMGVE
jgi:transposase